MPKHLDRIRSAIDKLPSGLDFDVPQLPETGLSQGLESSHLSQPDTDPASVLERMTRQDTLTTIIKRSSGKRHTNAWLWGGSRKDGSGEGQSEKQTSTHIHLQ